MTDSNGLIKRGASLSENGQKKRKRKRQGRKKKKNALQKYWGALMSGCIAFDIKNGNFACTATTNETCEGEQCAFYKTQKAQRASLEKSYARFRAMPDEQQQSIADTYYGGKTPWNT